jgi:O-antigen/teichoic acid export membrane protein
MSKNKYILETLFYIGFPKIFTFFISLISFPILIRSFGAYNYGTVLYISSTISIFEVLIDFGVPSAAGKSLSIYRVKSPHFIKNEFTTWFKMQLVTILIGVLPLFLVSKYILATTSKFNITNEILVIAIITVLTNAILSFLRPILTSLLAFKFLSILDTVESILRSFSYIMIAFFSPNIIGYLSASLIISILSTILAFTFVLAKINNYTVDNFNEKDKTQFITNYKFNLLESIQFLWLKLFTRLYQELPTFLIGKLAGPEIIGVIGAFKRILEIVSTPYLIIGNSLSVKIHELHNKGKKAFLDFWTVIIKILSTSLIFVILLYFSSNILGSIFLPTLKYAGDYFTILTLMIPATCVFGLIAPMSDYFGGLKSRNKLLTFFLIFQLPFFYLSTYLGNEAILITYVSINILLSIGYILISNQIFFDTYRIKINRSIVNFILYLFISFIISLLIISLFHHFIIKLETVNVYYDLLFNIITFIIIFYFLLKRDDSTFALYINKNFFNI